MRSLQRRGLKVLGMKPVATGCELRDGLLQNDDAVRLQPAGSVHVAYDLVNPYALAPPLAPSIAASLVGHSIDILPHGPKPRTLNGAGKSNWYRRSVRKTTRRPRQIKGEGPHVRGPSPPHAPNRLGLGESSHVSSDVVDVRVAETGCHSLHRRIRFCSGLVGGQRLLDVGGIFAGQRRVRRRGAHSVCPVASRAGAELVFASGRVSRPTGSRRDKQYGP